VPGQGIAIPVFSAVILFYNLMNKTINKEKGYVDMELSILSAQEFYTQEEAYLQEIGPTWDEEAYQESEPDEILHLSVVLGPGDGKSVLDCSCGTGFQAIPLAKLGWQVTATDVTALYMDKARQRAEKMGQAIHFQACDMRHLSQFFDADFDQVVTCMALDNITEDEGIRQAIRGMYVALKPAGRLYIRLRDFDWLFQDRTRYDLKYVRPVPQGTFLRMEDWIFESETHVVMVEIYYLEDQRKTGYRWSSQVFAFRRRALRKVELEGFLWEAGFKQVEFLPQPDVWAPWVEVVAVK
jgi:glycine/sarcosine N-methyltransferase